MRPKVSVGADGSVSGSLEVVAGEKEALPALQERMRHAEALARKAKRKLTVVLDEFSDLEKYSSPSVEKALRAETQQQAAIGYIFSGSEEAVMLSIPLGMAPPESQCNKGHFQASNAFKLSQVTA
jgi:hypothetical protein